MQLDKDHFKRVKHHFLLLFMRKIKKEECKDIKKSYLYVQKRKQIQFQTFYIPSSVVVVGASVVVVDVAIGPGSIKSKAVNNIQA